MRGCEGMRGYERVRDGIEGKIAIVYIHSTANSKSLTNLVLPQYKLSTSSVLTQY